MRMRKRLCIKRRRRLLGLGVTSPFERASPSQPFPSADRRPSPRVSPQTRERINAAATELNHRPNFAGPALKVSRTDVIALIAPDLTNSFPTELMLGVEEEANRLAYMLLLGRSENLQPSSEMISRLLAEGRVDGMLVQVGDTTSRAARL
jgi:LacI family transcriptional regulator